mgnify:CR=1 FL=1
MNITSMMLIMELVVKGVGVASEIQELAKRCTNGEEITAEEIIATGKELDAAVDKFLTAPDSDYEEASDED